MKLSKTLIRNGAAFMLFLFALYFKVAAASPLTDWQDRKYIRDTWHITERETSSAELDKLLNSKYPGSQMTWRALLDAIEMTDGVLARAKRDRLEIAIEKAMNNAALSNQLKLYLSAREAGNSHEAILNQTADKVEFDSKGWILTLDARSTSRAAPPTGTVSAQVWQVGSLSGIRKPNRTVLSKREKKLAMSCAPRSNGGGGESLRQSKADTKLPCPVMRRSKSYRYKPMPARCRASS